jgi:hypothetical protein
MEKNKCIICKKDVPSDKKEQKFCTHYCRLLHNSRQQYYNNKDNPVYRKKVRDNFKKWYANNKERQKANVIKSYYTHKEIWAVRTFNTTYRHKLQEILPKTCFVCGKEGQEYIGIKDTSKTDRPRIIRNQTEKNNLNMLEYSKNLVNLCSRDCLGKIHRRDFSFDKDGYS